MLNDELSVAERLREKMAQFTASEQKAARVLLTNYPLVGLETASEFARLAGVSAPSVLRFVAKLGFESYLDFQRQIRREINAQIKPPLEKAKHEQAKAGSFAFLEQFAETVCHNIEASVRHIPPGEFEAVATLMCDRERKLFLVGGRLSDPLAHYAAAHLRVVRRNVFHLSGQNATWRDQLLELKAGDVLIVFDIRRYQDDLLALCELAVGHGAVVVLLTDQWLSPIVRLAKHTLAARIAVPSNWDSTAALLTLVEALVASVTRRLWRSAARRIETIEEMRAQSGHKGPAARRNLT